MFENPLNYGEEPDDYDPFSPDSDPIQKAAAEQREKLKKEAEEKAAKEAKLAKKLADKAAKKLEEKTDQVKGDAKEASQAIANTKEAIEEMSASTTRTTQVTEAGASSPVEMSFSNGSEYISELKEGEEAIFDLHSAVEKVEDTIDLADEVTARAEAIANARAALDEVVGAEVTVPHIEDNPVLPSTLESSENLELEPSVEQNTDLPLEDANIGHSTSEYSNQYAPSSALDARPESSPYIPETNRSVVSKFIAGTGAGFLTTRAKALRRNLVSAEAKLRGSSGELAREINLQANKVTENRVPEQEAPIEMSLDSRSVTPEWVIKLIGEVKKGKVSELKKWQLDVLKSQYPDILKSYKKLDKAVAERVRAAKPEQSETAQNIPGELPKPIVGHGLAEDVNLKLRSIPNPLQNLPQSLSYVPTTHSSASMISSSYITIVTVGGVIFGSILIMLFGF